LSGPRVHCNCHTSVLSCLYAYWTEGSDFKVTAHATSSKYEHTTRQAAHFSLCDTQKHCLALQMMHRCAMLWLKGQTLLSWLAFGISASAATSRFSSNSRPVYIRYQTAAPAAAFEPPSSICHLSYNSAAAAIVEDSLVYHAADAAVLHYYPSCHYAAAAAVLHLSLLYSSCCYAAAAAVVQYSLLYHLCHLCCRCCCSTLVSSVSIMLLLLLLFSTTHFHAAIAAAASAVIALWLHIKSQPNSCLCRLLASGVSLSVVFLSHMHVTKAYGVLSRDSWKGRRCMLSSRQPLQRRLQDAFRLCGEADWPDAAQPHCKLYCNSSGSLTGQLLQSRSVM